MIQIYKCDLLTLCNVMVHGVQRYSEKNYFYTEPLILYERKISMRRCGITKATKKVNKMTSATFAYRLGGRQYNRLEGRRVKFHLDYNSDHEILNWIVLCSGIAGLLWYQLYLTSPVPSVPNVPVFQIFLCSKYSMCSTCETCPTYEHLRNLPSKFLRIHHQRTLTEGHSDGRCYNQS